MHHRLEPLLETADRRRWEAGDTWIEAARTGAAWHVTMSWTPDAMLVADEPVVGTRLGDDEAVAQLLVPVALAPRQELELWLEWPLALVVEVGGVELATVRPDARRTVLGTVEDGHVLPAAFVRTLVNPDEARAPMFGAVRVAFSNEGSEPVVLRRCPIAEGTLSLFRKADALVAGSMVIRVAEAGRAEASHRPLPGLPGFTPVPRDQPSAPRGRFDWLLDATRRSTEFQP